MQYISRFRNIAAVAMIVMLLAACGSDDKSPKVVLFERDLRTATAKDLSEGAVAAGGVLKSTSEQRYVLDASKILKGANELTIRGAKDGTFASAEYSFAKDDAYDTVARTYQIANLLAEKYGKAKDDDSDSVFFVWTPDKGIRISLSAPLSTLLLTYENEKGMKLVKAEEEAANSAKRKASLQSLGSKL